MGYFGFAFVVLLIAFLLLRYQNFVAPSGATGLSSALPGPLIVLCGIAGVEFLAQQVWVVGYGAALFIVGMAFAWGTLAMGASRDGTGLVSGMFGRYGRRWTALVITVGLLMQLFFASLMLYQAAQVVSTSLGGFATAVAVGVMGGVLALDLAEAKSSAWLMWTSFGLLLISLWLLAVPASISVAGWLPNSEMLMHRVPDVFGLINTTILLGLVVLCLPVLWESVSVATVERSQRISLLVMFACYSAAVFIAVAASTGWHNPQEGFEANAVWPAILTGAVSPLFVQLLLMLGVIVNLTAAYILTRHCASFVLRLPRAETLQSGPKALAVAVAVLAVVSIQALTIAVPDIFVAANAGVAVLVMPTVVSFVFGLSKVAMIVNVLLALLFYATALTEKSPGDPGMWAVIVCVAYAMLALLYRLLSETVQKKKKT